MAKKIKFTPSGNSSNKDTLNLNDNLRGIEEHLNDRALYRDVPQGEPNSMQNDILVGGVFARNLHVGSMGTDLGKLYPEEDKAFEINDRVDGIEIGRKPFNGPSNDLCFCTVTTETLLEFYPGGLIYNTGPSNTQGLGSAYYGKIGNSYPEGFWIDPETGIKEYYEGSISTGTQTIDYLEIGGYSEKEAYVTLNRTIPDITTLKSDYYISLHCTSGIKGKNYSIGGLESVYGITRSAHGTFGTGPVASDVETNWNPLDTSRPAEGGHGFIPWSFGSQNGKNYLANIAGNLKVFGVSYPGSDKIHISIDSGPTIMTGVTSFDAGPSDSSGKKSLIYTDIYGKLNIVYLNSEGVPVNDTEREALGQDPLTPATIIINSKHVCTGVKYLGGGKVLVSIAYLEDDPADRKTIGRIYQLPKVQTDLNTGERLTEYQTSGMTTLNFNVWFAGDSPRMALGKREREKRLAGQNLTSNRIEGTQVYALVGVGKGPDGEDLQNSEVMFNSLITTLSADATPSARMAIEKINVSIQTPIVVTDPETLDGSEGLSISDGGAPMFIPLTSLIDPSQSYEYVTTGLANRGWTYGSKVYSNLDQPFTISVSLVGAEKLEKGAVSVSMDFGFAYDIYPLSTLGGDFNEMVRPTITVFDYVHPKFFKTTRYSNVVGSPSSGSADLDMIAIPATMDKVSLGTQELVFGSGGYITNPTIQYTYLPNFWPNDPDYGE